MLDNECEKEQKKIINSEYFIIIFSKFIDRI